MLSFRHIVYSAQYYLQCLLLLAENAFSMIFSLSISEHFPQYVFDKKKRMNKKEKNEGTREREKEKEHTRWLTVHTHPARITEESGRRIRAREGGAGLPVGGLIYMLIARQQSLPMSASAQSDAALFCPS